MVTGLFMYANCKSGFLLFTELTKLHVSFGIANCTPERVSKSNLLALVEL